MGGETCSGPRAAMIVAVANQPHYDAESPRTKPGTPSQRIASHRSASRRIAESRCCGRRRRCTP
eukprot:scaffold1042_cov401-Prasinococcus_capsulatus_cf.AAC.5